MTSTASVSADPVSSNARETRFAFGKNWQKFLQRLDDGRIAEAERSLCALLEIHDLTGKSFLDIGCGSGLFSLAALRLGAARVHSFDYDRQSVACAQELKRRYFQQAQNWTIEQGSALDAAYLSRLGQFDVVYSWGVLHHTGDMWQALENVIPTVAPGGRLFLALYNDEGLKSKFWRSVKRKYNQNLVWRSAIVGFFVPYFSAKGFIKDLALLRNPLNRYRHYQKTQRGMSYFIDVLDWLGGYPFEVAKIEEVFEFFRERKFELIKLKTPVRPMGNNEYVLMNRNIAH